VDGGRAPIGRATKSTDQAVANDTAETMLLDTAEVDPMGMVKLATDRIEAVVPGYYRVGAYAQWASTSGAGQRQINLFKNSTSMSLDNRGGSAAFAVTNQAWWEGDFAAGDYTYATLYQNSGAGAQNVVANTRSPTLFMSWIGPRP
jgi:hypothetical protein